LPRVGMKAAFAEALAEVARSGIAACFLEVDLDFG
jgi:hypothetical protein